MNDIQKKAREDYTNAMFDAIWDGKRVWDAIVDMETNRHIRPSKALNCRSQPGGWNEIKYEMDWKDTGLRVVVDGFLRPLMGIWEFFFGDAKDKCFNKAVKWLDKASDEKQSIIFTVKFIDGNTPVQGMDRNHKLTEKFIDYLNSLQPEVSQQEANRRADEIIQNN